MSWELEVATAAQELSVVDMEVSQSAITLATKAISLVDQRFGGDAARPLPYHNAEHSLAVCRRGMRMLNLLSPCIKLEKWGEDLADVVFVTGATHDLVQGLGRGKDERASRAEALELIDAAAERRKKPTWEPRRERFKGRVGAAIMATEVVVKETGEISQTNIAVGEPDPAKLIVAFADINGIAMEGPERMIQDSINLYAELNAGHLDAVGIAKFLENQSGFIKSRLRKNRVQSDLAYYFPDQSMIRAYRVLEKTFSKNVNEVVGHAEYLSQNATVFAALITGVMQIAKMKQPQAS